MFEKYFLFALQDIFVSIVEIDEKQEIKLNFFYCGNIHANSEKSFNENNE